MIGGVEEASASFEARSAPRLYPTPPNWHCDWQGPWEFERLRRLATLLLARAPGYRVHFDVIVPGYVKVDVLHYGHIVGEVYVRKGESDGGVFCVSLGAQEEHQVRTEAEAVRLLRIWDCSGWQWQGLHEGSQSIGSTGRRIHVSRRA
jgi:hypothetical protein